MWTVCKHRCHGGGFPDQSIKTKTKSTLKAEIVFIKEMKEKLDITFKLRKKYQNLQFHYAAIWPLILMSCVTAREMTRKSDDVYSAEGQKSADIVHEA